MKLLIAEDDAFFRRLLQQVLDPEYELSLVEDGIKAWRALQEVDGPRLAILDWVMPGMSGPQVCRKVREQGLAGRYLTILTAKNSAADILSGLRAGADDYVTKPFDPEELRARVRVGKRVVELQDAVEAQAILLRKARESERELLRLLPICRNCHRIRSDAGYWLSVERFLGQQLQGGNVGECPWCAQPAETSGTSALISANEVNRDYVRTHQ